MKSRCLRALKSYRFKIFLNDNNNNKRHSPQKRCLFCGVELDQVEEVSYLGITFTSKFWVYVMRRNQIGYKSIVRPKLECASTAWDPYTIANKTPTRR